MLAQSECVFKVSKYASQAFITDPEIFESALKSMKEFVRHMPAHVCLHSLKCSGQSFAKSQAFDDIVSVLSKADWRAKVAVDHDGVDDDFVESFLTGIHESTAAKFFSKITAQDSDADTDADATDGSIPCCRMLYEAFAQSALKPVQVGCTHAHALLAPTKVPASTLSAALAAVVGDGGGPFLKPFLSGPAAQTLLANAVAVFEDRETEEKADKQLKEIEQTIIEHDREGIDEGIDVESIGRINAAINTLR